MLLLFPLPLLLLALSLYNNAYNFIMLVLLCVLLFVFIGLADSDNLLNDYDYTILKLYSSNNVLILL